MGCLDSFYEKHKNCEEKVRSAFEIYGKFVARHPWKIIIIVCVINIGLSFGLFAYSETDFGLEQFVPTDSTASKNRDEVRQLYPNNSNFYRQNLPDFGYYASVIIERIDGGNILDNTLFPEIRTIYSYVNTTTAYDDNGNAFKYEFICAKRSSVCVVEGDFIFSGTFLNDLNAGTIHYPNYTHQGDTVYIDIIIGDVEYPPATDFLTSATALKLTFNLDSERSSLSRKWELAYIQKIATYSGSALAVKYKYSDSRNKELPTSLDDKQFIIPTSFLMVLVPTLILTTCNCKVNRLKLGLLGLLGIVLATLGSYGLVSLCGSSISIIPLLLSGIWVMNMLTLLSDLADTNRKDDAETQVGQIMKTGGINITITTIIYVIVFFAGAASVFPNVRYFSYYAGCSCLFNYITLVTYFIGCIALSERDPPVISCKYQCYGSPENDGNNGENSTQNENKRMKVEGPIEYYPKKYYIMAMIKRVVCVILFVVAILFVGFGIWGTVVLEKDLDISELYNEKSYYRNYYDTDQTKFSQSMIVSLNFNTEINYRLNTIYNQIDTMIANVRTDNQIQDDFLISWIHSYRSAGSYDDSTDAAFISGLQTYLQSADGNQFIADITIDTTASSISASRIYVRTTSVKTSKQQSNMMENIRKIVDSSSLSVFAYSPGFVLLEQYVAIHLESIKTHVVCFAVFFLVTVITMPYPLMLVIFVLNVIIVMIEVIAFSSFWGITLNSITLVPFFMCVAYCINCVSGICYSFINTDGNRKERVKIVLSKTYSFVIYIGFGLSLLLLVAPDSYMGTSLGKVMLLTTIFGMLQSNFFLPAVLNLIGLNCKVEVYGTGNGNDDISMAEKEQVDINGILPSKEVSTMDP